MKKVRYRCALAVATVLLCGRAGALEPLMHLTLRAHIVRGTCDVFVSDGRPAAWRTLSRDAFPSAGGAYRGRGFVPVRVAFSRCTTNLAEGDDSIRLQAGSVGLQDTGLAAQGLWRAGDAGVGFDVLVREPGKRSGIAHRLTPQDNLLRLNRLHGRREQDMTVPVLEVESRLRSYVRRESITPGVVKTILLLSVVYG